MELTFAQQSTAFLWSLALGVIFAVAYGPFKIFRMCFCNGKISVFTVDFIYMISASLALFYFSLAYLTGYIRAYTYLGCFIGFLAYRLTIGRLTSKIYSPIICFSKRILKKFGLKIKNFTKKLLKIDNKILYNIKNRISIFRNKHSDKDKKVTADEEKRDDKVRAKTG